MPRLTLTEAVQSLLERYKRTDLAARWAEAVSFGAGANAEAYFIHEAEDSVNVIWLNSDGIRDITVLFGAAEQSMFNFVLLKELVTIETRQGKDMAKRLGLTVDGYYVARAMVAAAPQGTLYWVAHTRNEARALRVFISTVLNAFASAR